MKSLFAGLLLCNACVAFAQSNVGDLIDRGAKRLTRADYEAMTPFRIKYVWPQGGGEGDLVYKADGTLSGSEFHYGSKTESPATGTWVANEDGKWCMKKTMSLWNSRTDMCWHTYQLGDDFYGAASDSARNGQIAKYRSFARQ